MFPHIGPEFVEALVSQANDRPVQETSRTPSRSLLPEKSPACRAPFWHVTLRAFSHIWAIVSNRWMIYLLLVCL
jgi:hypothetical protein